MSPETERLLCELRIFVEESNVNLGRKTKRRTEFIDGVVELATKLLPQDAKVAKPAVPPSKVVDQRMVVTKSKKVDKMRNGKHSFSMTESESMRADEELGTAPFGGTNE